MDLKTLASLAQAWRERAWVCDEEAKRFMDGSRERIANERYRDAYLQCAHDLEIAMAGGRPYDQPDLHCAPGDTDSGSPGAAA